MWIVNGNVFILIWFQANSCHEMCNLMSTFVALKKQKGLFFPFPLPINFHLDKAQKFGSAAADEAAKSASNKFEFIYHARTQFLIL